MAKHILIVDDDKAIRNTLKEILEFQDYEVSEAKDGEEALKLLTAASADFQVVISDVRMPKLDGIGLLEKAMQAGVQTPFIMLSAHGNIDTAVEATKLGAYDFLSKPPELNRLMVSVRNALNHKVLLQETQVLKEKLKEGTPKMIGESEAIKEIRDMIVRVAPSDARVLITGPNGSGKELVASSIHQQSKRSKQSFVVVNCAAIPGELIESELFGHEKGSFTSAIRQHIGKFEQASDGTLFLDEIGDMSLPAQAKVLRALQEQKITRIGGDKDIEVNVRILAATNKNLKEEIAAGRFREDLYHRLAVVIIQVPALAARKSDIPLLIDRFLEELATEQGKPAMKISPKAVSYLQNLPWSGNIRELRNVVERLTILGSNPITEAEAKRFAS